MRRITLLALIALTAVALLVPATQAAASDVSLNNAVAQRSGKLNKLSTAFNNSIAACNKTQLKDCSALFSSASKLRTATLRTVRAVDRERASTAKGTEAKRATLRSLRAQVKSVRSAPAFIRAARKGENNKAMRLQKQGNRYGRIAARNAEIAKKLFDEIADR